MVGLEERAKKIWRKLQIYVDYIERGAMRKAVLDLMEKPIITFTRVEPRISLWESPAAPRKHHAYPGGLLDHTLGVTEISLRLVEVYEKVYGTSVDRDVVIAAAILHDLFKYYQYEPDPLTGGYRPRSDWYLSHDFAMVAELSKRGAPEKLVRAVAETHGTVPFTMLESQLVHQADTVDSNIVANVQDILWRVCQDLELEIEGVKAIRVFHEALRRASIFDYARVYYESGRDGLRTYIKKILGL